MNRMFALETNWKLFLHTQRQIPESFSMPEEGISASVPGTVHTDLISAGLIPDPFFGMNEKELQWIAENDWRYETVFDLPDDAETNAPLWLVFDGLDTVAEIWLNDRPLAATQNMFRSYRFKVNSDISKKGNRLRIVFRSPLQWVRTHKRPIRQMPSVRHPDRVFLRKTQYSFGWDWGPQYPTTGIWRPVYLLRQRAGIEHIYFETSELKNDHARIRLKCTLWGEAPEDATIEYELHHKERMLTGRLKGNGKVFRGELQIDRPELWWPNGQGDAALHQLTLRLKDDAGNVLDERERLVGIRTVELVTEKKGKPEFYFKINGRKIFVKGANWIPADSFLPRVKKETYTQLLTLAKDGHLNALRVWGGGIYEDDAFYELCDRLGLMVWQDLMFACAGYPEEADFLQEVRDELADNIGRLQAHPSIILWCGNNENEWIWHRDMGTPTAEMPGFELFHQKIPTWLKEWDTSRPYWPTTPWGNEADPNAWQSGNRHAWEIWSFWKDYASVQTDQSLFVTEFGFQAPAHVQTMRNSLPETDCEVQSQAFEWHNKQEEGPERLFRFLSGHLPVHTKFEDFIYLTQLNQAFALQSCLEHWRTNGMTNGAIIWQINDCWPVSSWSFIDYDLRPKLSYYQIKRSFAPVLLTFKRIDSGFKLLLKNESRTSFSGKIVLMRFDTQQGNLRSIFEKTLQQNAGKQSLIFNQKSSKQQGVWIATAYDENGSMVARNVFPETKWKYLVLPSTKGKIHWNRVGKNQLEIRSTVPAFFVELRHPEFNFSDQGFVLLPNEVKQVQVLNAGPFNPKDIEIVTLNDYLVR